MARERAIANQLSRLLDLTTQSLYVIDDRRRLVYCNAACAAWLGVSVEQIVGQRCDYHAGDSGDPLADLAARLCPPPDVYGGQAKSAEVSCRDGEGQLSRRHADFFPLPGEEGEVVGILALLRTVHDPDEGERQNELLADEATRLHQRLQALLGERRTAYRMERLVGESWAIRRVRQQVELAVQTPVHVQICGPAGSGREHLARTIHGRDPLSPMLPLVCPLLDAELLQATVVAFLHRSLDTEPAHAATLLLLDADQLNSEAQAEMLAFYRIPTFTLRTIATTRTPLLKLAAEGSFHAELAYRLSTLVIELPPLAARREDIPLLCQQLLEIENARGGKQLSGFAPAVLDRLCALPWRGNIDELAQVVRELWEQSDGPRVTDVELSRHGKHVTSAMTHPAPEVERIDLDEFLVDVERELLQRALRQTKGNKAEAARLLGISRARVIRRVEQLGLE